MQERGRLRCCRCDCVCSPPTTDEEWRQVLSLPRPHARGQSIAELTVGPSDVHPWLQAVHPDDVEYVAVVQGPARRREDEKATSSRVRSLRGSRSTAGAVVGVPMFRRTSSDLYGHAQRREAVSSRPRPLKPAPVPSATDVLTDSGVERARHRLRGTPGKLASPMSCAAP